MAGRKRIIPEVGTRYGKLVVLGEAADHVSRTGKKLARSLCSCDCGGAIVALNDNLRLGKVHQCSACVDRQRSESARNRVAK